MTAAKIIATAFGIGYIEKGAGTVAALFYCAVWWYGKIGWWPWWGQAVLIIALFFGGIWAGNVVEEEWGHDSNRVVIDEVLGMAVSLFMVWPAPQLMVVAFVLFRFFDIRKPLGIRRAERLPSGTGVMADDLLAGAYAVLLLHLALFVYIQFFIDLP